ncbi:hypothetical protein [Micromonospora sp. WMMC273]|uniref:hypothetical protein n=1 Tax=Micromonospora sp. WMMC273 TaxID=3015157 RepID=UPI0022B5E691|nr:hypothetical protein [Micromonospora sp. WMMC273]MCZ7478864.1 hypothetical protein [Micromonospora sp. WMMC273]MCZ7478973.1 hypothetical protein [Micromonospora sp. WMMC273]
MTGAVGADASGELVWVCGVCGQELGDFSQVASGDCVFCELIMGECCFVYDERKAEVSCPPGRCRDPQRR